jgi:hypothetical protein
MKATFSAALCGPHYSAHVSPELLLAVLVGVGHHSLFGMLRSVNYMAPRGVGMMCRLFVMSRVVMFGGFPVVVGGMRQLF